MVDFGLTAKDYARHRTGFPDSLFKRLLEYGIGIEGQRIVDIGTGTGSLARGFAKQGSHVIGIDPSESLLEQAKLLDKEEGVEVVYRVGVAEDTGLDSSFANVVSAGQCWHWFEGEKAAKEAVRILQFDGKIVITHFDWLPLSGNIVEETETLISKHNPKWNMGGGIGIYPQWLVDLGEAGFVNLQTFSFDIDVPYKPDDWRGRIRASAGVGASLSPEEVEIFDSALANLLAEKFPSKIIEIPHRVWTVIGENAEIN